MKTPVNYLDDLKAKTGSDYMTAKKSGIDKTTISSIRKRGQMSDRTETLRILDQQQINKRANSIAENITPIKRAEINC